MIFYVYGKSFESLGGTPTVPTTRKDMPDFLIKDCKCIGKWVPIPQKKKTEPYFPPKHKT